VKGTGPDGAITKEDVDHVIAKTEKLNEKISAPAAIRSAIAAAMSKSNREIPHYWKKDRLDKSIGLVTETNNQRSVKKTAPRCPSYKGNSETS
jgi:pyruvate dehydrogenase E2 component (dihydrolipoamide acetyltransferase)